MWDGPGNRPERLLHWITCPFYNSRLVDLETPHLANFGKLLGSATMSPCTFTMDHNAIVCSMTDRLARGPDQDVHVPSVGSTKVPFSWCRCHILVIDYRWGSMESDETATMILGGPWVIRVFFTVRGAIGPKLFTFFGRRSALGLRLG